MQSRATGQLEFIKLVQLTKYRKPGCEMSFMNSCIGIVKSRETYIKSLVQRLNRSLVADSQAQARYRPPERHTPGSVYSLSLGHYLPAPPNT